MSKYDKTITSLCERKHNFITRANNKHNYYYDYSKIVYVNMYLKVIIICPIHGEFEQVPHDHIKGAGCQKCSKLRVSNYHIISYKQFCKRAGKVHDNKYTYDENYYTKSSDKLTITCLSCDYTFEQQGTMHLLGQGCPNCNKRGFSYNKPAILYYLSINNEEAFKIGITNYSVNSRFLVKDLKIIKVLKTWAFCVGRDAFNVEQQIIRDFSNLKYTKSPLLSTGNSELFKEDILMNLESDYIK